jgi:hypothetical protein
MPRITATRSATNRVLLGVDVVVFLGLTELVNDPAPPVSMMGRTFWLRHTSRVAFRSRCPQYFCLSRFYARGISQFAVEMAAPTLG